MRGRRVRDHLIWADDAGVAHALVEDTKAEREPPYPLLSLCDAGMHTHEHSAQIRAARPAPLVTCVRCVEALLVGRAPTTWPDNDDAPCCSLVARAT